MLKIRERERERGGESCFQYALQSNAKVIPSENISLNRREKFYCSLFTTYGVVRLKSFWEQ